MTYRGNWISVQIMVQNPFTAVFRPSFTGSVFTVGFHVLIQMRIMLSSEACFA
jgi:hypothetical protein